MFDPIAIFTKAFVRGQLLPAGKLAKTLELRIVADRQNYMTVTGLKSLVGHDIGMRVTQPSGIVAARKIIHRLVGKRGHLHVEQRHIDILPYQAFQTGDGHIILAVGNDAQFERFCELAGRQELAADERFRKNSDRVKHRLELIPQIADIMLRKSSAQWLEALNSKGIPCGPINNIGQVFDDPQVEFRGLQLELEHPLAGSVASVANPIRLSQTPIEYRQAPPLLGQHTDEVLGRLLSLGAAALAQLRAEGIIA